MPSDPVVLIPHQVGRESAEELADILGERLPDGVLRVAITPDETDEYLPEAEAIVTFRLPDGVPAETPKLGWVQALSAGVDHYDRETLASAGITLTNASGVHAEPIAEQVLGYMLTFERRLHEAARQQRDNTWARLRGGELRGKTVGIVGVGAIGSRVAELAGAFDTTVLGTKRDPSSAPDAVDEIFGPEGIWELLERSDHLVVACPLTEETRGLIGADELRVLSSDAVVINIARGEVIDQDALVRTLRGGRIDGAALDVFEEEPLPPDSPLWDLSNVVVTPHMSGSTPEYLRRCGDIVVENYEQFREGDVDGMQNRIF